MRHRHAPRPISREEQAKRIIIATLHWIDNRINHTLIDWLFDVAEKFCDFDTVYVTWERTSHEYCVSIHELHDLWFPLDFKTLQTNRNERKRINKRREHNGYKPS